MCPQVSPARASRSALPQFFYPEIEPVVLRQEENETGFESRKPPLNGRCTSREVGCGARVWFHTHDSGDHVTVDLSTTRLGT